MLKRSRSYVILFLILIGAFLLSSCRASSEEVVPTPFIEGEEEQFIGIPNPASFYCQEMGYELELKETSEGTVGICVFPNGSECEEWDFLAGGCFIEWTFCQRQGFNISTGEDGAICTFPDGSSCPEYEFFIGECQAPE